jgi:hypothetical protein
MSRRKKGPLNPVVPFIHDNDSAFVQRTPMKSVYSRFDGQSVDTSKPNVIRFQSTLAARAFCIISGATGLTLIAAKFTADMPWLALAGGALLLLISSLGYAAWLRESTICIDRENNLVTFSQKGLIGKYHKRSYPISEIAGIQILNVDLGGAEDVDVRTYEVNVVLSVPHRKRLWLYSNRDPAKALSTACKIAAFLKVGVMDHSRTDASAHNII